MFSINKSDYKEEIETFLARGGIVTILPPQDSSFGVTAKPKNSSDEDNEEIYIDELSTFVDGGVFYRNGTK